MYGTAVARMQDEARAPAPGSRASPERKVAQRSGLYRPFALHFTRVLTAQEGRRRLSLGKMLH